MQELDAAGAQLRAAGLTLSFRNHRSEFVRYRGAPAIDSIYDPTDPRNLLSIIDTDWIHYGCGDVVA